MVRIDMSEFMKHSVLMLELSVLFGYDTEHETEASADGHISPRAVRNRTKRRIARRI